MAIIDRQFLRDTAMMDRYFMPDSLAGRKRLPLSKTADIASMVSSFLGTVGGAISDFVTNEIQKFNDDWPAALAELTLEGLIGFYGGWFINLLDIIAEIAGFKPFEMFKKIKADLLSHLKQNGSINSNVINQVVNQNVGGASLADDHAIKEAWERVGLAATILKQAGVFDWLVKGPGVALFERFIDKKAATTWLGGFFRWIMKIIIGAVSMAVKRRLVQAPFSGGKPDASGNTSEQTAHETSVPTAPPVPSWLKASGAGTEEVGAFWQVDVPLSSIGNTLVDWAVQVYPQLESQRAQLASSSALKNIVNVIKEQNPHNYYKSITWLPHNYGGVRVNSQKELIDLFVGEVANKMPESAETVPDTQIPKLIPATQ